MSAPNVDALYLPIADLGARIRARRLSPVDLTEAYLERIHRLSPRLNAYQTITDDLARSQARKAEDEIRKGNYRGPLHGIPYAAKDLFATAGVPTGWGVTPLDHQMFAEDATVIRKLREAGAILLGKTAMVEFAGGLGYRMPDASTTGPGRNPWNPQRWTGGSSSGSGAAVAAGLASYALGTETWGSILCPSAFCGLTGLRPTYGRVSRNGAMVCSWTFDKVGPIAHSAEDCRTILSAIAGHDPADATSSSEPADFPRQPLRPLNEVRAALVTLDFKVKGAQHEVEAAFNDAVTVLRGAGLSLTAAATHRYKPTWNLSFFHLSILLMLPKFALSITSHPTNPTHKRGCFATKFMKIVHILRPWLPKKKEPHVPCLKINVCYLLIQLTQFHTLFTYIH